MVLTIVVVTALLGLAFVALERLTGEIRFADVRTAIKVLYSGPA